jgi:hypothetical protein
MAEPTIAEVLKYANLQMAAEALYGFDASNISNLAPGDVTSDNGHYLNQAPSVEILTYGNRFASRFAQAEAEKFAAEWTVVDHLSNTETGFSGTLFKNTNTGPNGPKGSETFSFLSQ